MVVGICTQADTLRCKYPYAAKAAEEAVNAIQDCEDGCRNDTLNSEAFGLFGLVKAGRLPETAVRQILAGTAQGKGLDPPEVKRTLDSAFKAAQPRYEGMDGFKAAFTTTPITDHAAGN